MATQDEEKQPNAQRNQELKAKLQQASVQLASDRNKQRAAASAPASQAATAPAQNSPQPSAPEQPAAGGGLSMGQRLKEHATGAAKVAGGLLGAAPALALDTARNDLARLSGSELTPDQQTHFRDKIGGGLIARGTEHLGRAYAGAGNAVAMAIGATPKMAAPAVAQRVVESEPSSGTPANPEQKAQAAHNPKQWAATDSKIAMRVGANGSPEFSNQGQDLDGAQAMPGGEPLRKPGVSNLDDGVLLEQRGSMGNIGNGVGGASFGLSGDAARAIQSFGDANRERAESLRAQGGLRVSGLGDGGAMDRARDRRELEITAGHGARSQATQRGLVSAMGDKDQARQKALMDGKAQAQSAAQAAQENAQAEQQNSLAENEQRMQQARAKQIQQLETVIADQSLSAEQRNEARLAYSALTTPAKDRYVMQDAIIGTDEMGAPKYGKQVIDVTTGQPVSGAAQAPSAQASSAFEVGKAYKDGNGQRSRYKGVDESGRPVWEKV